MTATDDSKADNTEEHLSQSFVYDQLACDLLYNSRGIMMRGHNSSDASSFSRIVWTLETNP